MVVHPRDFHLRAGEIEIRRHDEHAIQSRRQNFFGDGRATQKWFIQTFTFQILQTKRTRRVSLRIEIDQQHAQTFLRERATEIDCGRRFSDAAFLIGNGNDLHRRGTINVRNSKVRRPSASRQSK